MILERNILRRVLVSGAVAIGLVATALTFAPPSFAGSYSVRSCDAFTTNHMSFGQDWRIGGLNGGIFPVNDCPAGIRFDTEQVTAHDAASVTWFYPNSESVLKSAEFEYYGGDASGDFEYTVRSCENLCDELLELTPGATKASPGIAQLTFPEDEGTTIAIEARCVQAFCADPPEFVVKNFDLEYADDVPPTVSNLQSVPEGALDPDANAWITGPTLKISFDAEDLGSGVAYADALLDTDYHEGLIPFVGESAFGAVLYGDHAPASGSFDIGELTDGPHSLTLIVADGSFTPDGLLRRPFEFRTDHTAPAEPEDITLSNDVTKWGWTSVPEVTISHADATLDPINTEFSGFKRAIFDLRAKPSAESATTETETDPSAPATLAIPHEGKWDAGVRYVDNAGNYGNRGHVSVGYDSDTPEPADPIPHDWISLADLHNGIDQSWTAPPEDPDLESGICAYTYLVDDELLTIPEPSADVLAPTTTATIPSGLGEGKHFVHIRAIACNGNASPTETVPVNVDGTPPTPTLHGVSASSDWSTAEPQVSLSATDELSGVAALEYQLDGDGSPILIPGSSTGIAVPAGDHTLSYRAIDVAGNASPMTHRRIQADWNLPVAEFLPADPARPNVVTANVNDSDSGLAGVGMQIRRTDAGASALEMNWRSLGELSAPAPAGKKSETFSRAIPDGEFPDGTYELRITARDIAGNWSESAPALQLRLPLRAKPALSAAIARVGKKSKVNWSGATQDRVIRFGDRTALVGTLQDGAGKPVVGAPITISATPEFGTPDRLPSVTTDGRGEFVVRLPNGPTRHFALHFAGSDRLQPIDQTATLRSRAALTLRVTPKTVRSRQPFWLSGRLLSGSMGLPEGGKVVTIEFLLAGKWVSTIATPRVDSKGRFRTKWPPGIRADRPTTVYIHVKAKRDSTWPFLTGSSEPVAVRVKP